MSKSYSKIVSRIGGKIELFQMVGACEGAEFADITVNYLRRLARRKYGSANERYRAIKDFLDYVEGK